VVGLTVVLVVALVVGLNVGNGLLLGTTLAEADIAMMPRDK
jgi:hypothetical protein